MAVRREDRVADEVKRILAKTIMHDLKDPRVPPFTSVTEVKVTRDFSYATCYISVLGTARQKKECLEALENSKGYLRTVLAKNLTLRVTPELRFKPDNTYDEGRRIDKLIDEAMGRNTKTDEEESEN